MSKTNLLPVWPPQTETPTPCGPAGAFLYEHLGRLLDSLALSERPAGGSCLVCGGNGDAGNCGAQRFLSRNYQHATKPLNARLGMSAAALVTQDGATIQSNALSIPAAAGVQIDHSRTRDFLGRIFTAPPEPPYLVIAFDKATNYVQRLRINYDKQTVHVSGPHAFSVDLIALGRLQAATEGLAYGAALSLVRMADEMRSGSLTPKAASKLLALCEKNPSIIDLIEHGPDGDHATANAWRTYILGLTPKKAGDGL